MTASEAADHPQEAVFEERDGRTVHVWSTPGHCSDDDCGRCTSPLPHHKVEAIWSFSVTIGPKTYGPYSGYHFDITQHARNWKPLPERPAKSSKRKPSVDLEGEE